MAFSVQSANRMVHILSILFACCVVSLVFGNSTANAQSGLMLFSGAVVAPTCSAAKSARIVSSSQRANSGRFDCVGAGGALDTARSYVQKIVHLDTTNIAGNRLLMYFAGREIGAGIPLIGAELVKRTFI